MNGNNFRKSNEKGSQFIEIRRHKQFQVKQSCAKQVRRQSPRASAKK